MNLHTDDRGAFARLLLVPVGLLFRHPVTDEPRRDHAGSGANRHFAERVVERGSGETPAGSLGGLLPPRRSP